MAKPQKTLGLDEPDPPLPIFVPIVVSRRMAWVVTFLVALHLAAVLSEPLRFFSQSDFRAGPEFLALRRGTAPYTEWMSLDHGYFFFAPNPGPSHLVATRAVSPPPILPVRKDPAGNTDIVSLDDFAYVFPDRKRQWPRLLYHRYFMLSEFYTNSFAPESLLEEEKADPELVERWKRDRGFYERLGESIRTSQTHSLGVERVELIRLERDLLPPDQVLREGWKIDDPRTLIVLPESPPMRPSEVIPQ